MKSDFKGISLEFATYLYSEKGMAEATCEAYNRDIRFFFSFLESRELKCDEKGILAYFEELKNKGYASASIARITFSIRVLFRFLIREKKCDSKTLLFLETPAKWALLSEVLTIEEMEKILHGPEKETFEGVRDRAILEVLYSSGLRVSELCSLNVEDVDDTFIKVMGKGKKERVVPIGKKAISAINAYHPFRDAFPPGPLFVNAKGKRLDRITIWRFVKRYAKKVGIEKKISPHTFRHSFATHLLEGGSRFTHHSRSVRSCLDIIYRAVHPYFT